MKKIILILIVTSGVFVSCQSDNTSQSHESGASDKISMSVTTKCPLKDTSWRDGKIHCSTHCTKRWKEDDWIVMEDTLFSCTDTVSISNARVEIYKEWTSSTQDHPIQEINQVYDVTKNGLVIKTRRKGEFGGF